MGLRDRFYTASTAKAIMSWRLPVGTATAVGLGVAGLPVVLAVASGMVVYGSLVAVAMPRGPRRPSIDAFAVGEPWRQFVQGAQRAQRRLHTTIRSVSPGPLRDRLAGTAAKLDHAVDQTWRIACRGNEIDQAVRRLEPARLQSRLTTLREQTSTAPSADIEAAIASIESQLASAERLQQSSKELADRLRLTETRLDELVARASEVAIGSGDTETYVDDVEDLVVEIEGLRLAVEETSTQDPGTS